MVGTIVITIKTGDSEPSDNKTDYGSNSSYITRSELYIITTLLQQIEHCTAEMIEYFTLNRVKFTRPFS